ncbi:MAG: hypothetical protein WHS86_10425 [Desulfosoma sp.]
MRLIGWLGLVSFLLVSCGGLRFGGLSPEQSLRQRAEAYWTAQKSKNWKEVRTYVDPEIVGTLDKYFKRREESQSYSTIVSAEIKDLEVRGDTGRTVTDVSAQLTHPLLGGKAYMVKQTVEERWVRRGGVWYVVIESPSLEDFLKKLHSKPGDPASGG